MDEWTLGSEDDYDTIYEQHNPDFIPAERGGPAVVVADSENGRVLEYQREDGDWEQSWTWEDRRLQWPATPTDCRTATRSSPTRTGIE